MYVLHSRVVSYAKYWKRSYFVLRLKWRTVGEWYKCRTFRMDSSRAAYYFNFLDRNKLFNRFSNSGRTGGFTVRAVRVFVLSVSRKPLSRTTISVKNLTRRDAV